MTIPQVLVTLAPDGHLVVELPGQQATRRQVPLRASDAGETLLRILQAQLAGHQAIGLEGAPTVAQLRHWEDHGTWPDARCAFCREESGAPSGQQRRRPQVLTKTPDGVEVRRLAPGQSFRHKTLQAKRLATDLDL